mgnify:CR=1 FL=1
MTLDCYLRGDDTSLHFIRLNCYRSTNQRIYPFGAFTSLKDRETSHILKCRQAAPKSWPPRTNSPYGSVSVLIHFSRLLFYLRREIPGSGKYIFCFFLGHHKPYCIVSDQSFVQSVMEPLSYLPIENACFYEMLAKQTKDGVMRERG